MTEEERLALFAGLAQAILAAGTQAEEALAVVRVTHEIAACYVPDPHALHLPDTLHHRAAIATAMSGGIAFGLALARAGYTEARQLFPDMAT